MSTLWTPDGEHRVDRSSEPETAAGPAAEPSGPPGGAEISREVLEEMAELETELLRAPVEEVIANHCYGLFQLAALHLGQHPPNLDAARLSIDALGAIVDHLDARLGEAAGTLRDGLAQLRLAFVQIAAAAQASDEPPGAQ